MASNVSNLQKEVARYTSSAFSVERPPIHRFWDDDHKSDVHVLCAANIPQDGVVSYATIGLSDHPLMFHGKEFGTRVEFVGACGSAFTGLDNVLATLAFCVINSKWFPAPGAIFPDVISMHRLSVTLSDVYFANPFLWEDGFKSTRIGDVAMAWLLAVPVSKAETDFAKRFGPEKLEDLFSEKDIDIYNLNRESVV